MEKVGVLVVSKCLSAPAMVDALLRSESYEPDIFVVERKANPFNLSRATEHWVVPDLDVATVSKTAEKLRGRASFALTDTEDFVIAGGRDQLERRSGIPLIGVTKKYAVERSKAEQRLLFDRIFPGANPRYRIFDPRDHPDRDSALADFRRTTGEMGMAAVKPDAPARGAGVGVWGSDFRGERGAEEFFLNLLAKGKVVVEEKLDGEESSFHAFSDGKHFVPAPLCRDYKRSFDGDRGPLTGGMGSYRVAADWLPFIRKQDWESLCSAEEAAFRKWRGRGSDPGLKGIVLYDAIMHTGDGFRVLERNSRGGNTEVVNLLATLADDFVDVCFRILEGTLRGIRFSRRPSVVTCVVPESYGSGGAPSAPSRIDFGRALEPGGSEKGPKLYPMDIELRDGSCWLGSSRAAAVVGSGASLDEARSSSQAGCRTLDGRVRWRNDIASPSSVRRSRTHLDRLRRAAA